MNKFYHYPHFDLWDEAKWEKTTSPILPLMNWITLHEAEYDSDGRQNIDDNAWKGYAEQKDYRSKTGSMNVPKVLQGLAAEGLYYEDRELGHIRWIVIVPQNALKKPGAKLKTLLVPHKGDYTDPYWAMRTMEYYRKYNKMALEENILILYLVLEAPDNNMMYANIIMEGLSIFPGDNKRIYLDLNSLYGTGHTLADVDGFAYKDNAVEKFGSLEIPVLNISAIWPNNKTNNFFQTTQCGNAAYNRERLIYSATGAKLAEGMAVEYQFGALDDPAMQNWLAEMGLYGAGHDKAGQRWIVLTPKGCTKKLPLVCVFQEVNYSNDHLIAGAFGQFLEYVKLAAEGELILLFFACENPDDNDLLYEIIKDAINAYPADPGRIYVTGHSHNGHFTREFAYRHPGVIAAAAPLGNFPGLPEPEESGEAVLVPDEKIEAMGRADMPIITIAGYTECGCMFPLNAPAKDLLPGQEFMCPLSFEARARSWQRRLKASRCPEKTVEEIAATAQSADPVERKLGIPCDRSEILFLDGFEHYIADIKNVDGKYHLRIVGIENMPHMPLPLMCRLSWSFMRRFARDLGTGNVMELQNDSN